ncbi:glycoside hydrolase family 10 protein [Deinococcus peraridilitoris]|uniref:Glycosyl hydrolase-like 10 domain-containing protein n=1 Tax=Deinococcus peraridilitoris (strain DSM 19664 / LMG 22246 / CIP 109416 / KR-200) TaxID=937777 RepID=L0A1V5_DEIPD|nr:family 10 glycosylhydrolase [Deinococcus peraridilitoris]AFZ67434.1 hypothetical protein Deipe_1931 [Deinococcus peraridilitoris DSM 19664]
MSKRLVSFVLLSLTVALSGCRERPQGERSADPTVSVTAPAPVTAPATPVRPPARAPQPDKRPDKRPVKPESSQASAPQDQVPAAPAGQILPSVTPAPQPEEASRPTPAEPSVEAAPEPSLPSAPQGTPGQTRPEKARPSEASSAPVSPGVSGPTSSARPAPAPGAPVHETVPTAPAPSAEPPARPVNPQVEAPAPTPAVKPPERRVGSELRGLWVDAFGPGFKTPQEVDQLIADARRMNVNVLFVQVGKRGDCYCNASSMPRTDDPAVPEGFDPLQDVLTKAHAAGLQVHAWIITTAIVNVSDNPAPSQGDHVFNTNGLSASADANWLMLRQDGEARAGNDYFLDPGHPEASEYIAEMYLSVVRNYDVDGVQLDRVRYPDAGGVPTWGYNPVALERFRQELGITGIPRPTDPAWMAWRREQITNLVRRIYLGVKAIRPEVWVDVATITYGPGPRTIQAFEASRAYTEVLQDWAQWARLGYFDLNVLMNYKRDDVPDQARWYDEWNAFAVKHRGTRLVAAGSAMYLNKPLGTLHQVNGALDAGLDGWVGYSYRTSDTSVNSGARTTAQALPDLTARFVSAGGPFGQAHPWKRPDTRALRAVEGRVTWAGEAIPGQSLGGRSVELYVNGRVFARTQTDGQGRYGFVFTPPGPFEVRTPGAAPLNAQAESGRVAELPVMTLP